MRFAALTVLLTVNACAAPAAAPAIAPPSTPAAESTPPSARAPAPAGSSPARVSNFPAAVHAFEEERLTGAMAVFDTRDPRLLCSDPERCERGYSPASTFKIANTIIALETGVVSDAESILPWDGKDYSVPDWNHDQTLRSAVQVSCVPCFQRIARTVGAPRMQDWVSRLGYGNANVSGAIDRFWLNGTLRISPAQQIDFLRRLDAAKLPIQERTLDVVRDVLTLDVTADYVLRGKTGLGLPPEEPSEVGWFVGFVELGERRVFFATVIDGHAADVDPKPVRRRVTERVLRELGALPS